MANLDALEENSMSSRWAYCIPIKILQMIAEKMCMYIYIYMSVCMCVCLEKNYVNIRQLPSTNWFLRSLPDSQSPRFFELGTTINPSKVLRDPTGYGWRWMETVDRKCPKSSNPPLWYSLQSHLPSGKQPHNYGKLSPCSSWVNPRFRLGHFP